MPAGATYKSIAYIRLGGAIPSVTFNNIPQIYTDLIVVVSGFDVPGNGYLSLLINNDTGTNYSRTTMSGNGSTTLSISTNNNTNLFPSIGNSSTNIGQEIIQFQNYSNTSVNKTILFRGFQSPGTTNAQVGAYRSTSAVTSISLSAVGGNIGTGSTFNLYGIAAA